MEMGDFDRALEVLHLPSVAEIVRQMKEDEAAGRFLETWNTCPSCPKKWKSSVPIPGVLHQIVVCSDCSAS